MKRRAAIIGAGISGLTTAIVLGEHGYEPVIFADQMSVDTTSAVAAAIWFPYDAVPENLVTPWALLTYGRLLEIARDADSGVSLVDCRTFSLTREIDIPWWADALGYRMFRGPDQGDRYQAGFSITVPLMETPIYLPYLEQRVLDAGGSFNHIDRLDKVDDIPDDDFSVIVNCSGYGSHDLVPDDGVEGHRGQVVIVPKVERAWAMVCQEPLTYVIPRQNGCVLGGVNSISWSRDIDPDSTATILERCRHEGVSIEPADVLSQAVGIRPYRGEGVRVALDETPRGRRLIHNYGHGGCGLSLSWGCAHKVYQLAELPSGSGLT